MNTSSKPVLNTFFLASLLILLINDLVLKSAFHNSITGKLSDLAGIIVFAGFFHAILGDKFKLWVYTGSALLFIFWKSSLSQGAIDFWNGHVQWIHFNRAVDYTDLFCLAALIPFYLYEPKAWSLKSGKKLVFYPLMAVTFLAITATSKDPKEDIQIKYPANPDTTAKSFRDSLR